jgi:AcrR family transcriptional regulator
MTVRKQSALARKSVAERRRERQIDEIRDEILESAAAAFARHGYRAATMQQIAAEAGYTAGSLYTYFDSKEAIFDALVKLVLDELYATFDAASDGDSFEERLELLLRRQFEVAERRRDAFAFFVRLSNGAEPMPERKDRHANEHDEAFITAMSRWLRVHTRREDLGQTSPEDAALVLNGIAHSFFLRWLREEGSSLADQAPRIVRLSLHGVRGAPG